MYNTLLKFIVMCLGVKMENQKFGLIDINEPCYFDFIYEDIKSNTNAEMLNTIFFEAIFRTREIKDIMNNSLSAEELLNDYLQKLNTEENIKNPLYESIVNFKKAVESLNTNLQILDSKKKNTISIEELIKIFFKGNKNQYQKVLETLKQISELISQDVLKNIELDINLDTIEENIKSNKSHINANPFDIFFKYGLDFNEVKSYLEERQSFLEEAVYFKKELLNNKISLSKYQKKSKPL